MAREHARILTRIWRDDDDWRSLPWEGQHMYFLLLSQPTLTHAGTLPLTLHRWSRLTEGRTPGDVEKTVRLLEDRRFVIVDWECEELLIRSFIRNDGVYRQPNVLKAAMRVVTEEVESKRLKEAIAEELLRVGLTEYAARLNPIANPSGNPSLNPSDGGGESLPEPSEQPSPTPSKKKASPNPSAKGSPPPSEGVPRESRGRGEGGVVSSSPVVGSVGKPAQKRGADIKTAQEITRAYVDRVPMSKFPAVLGVVRRALNANHSPDVITEALLRLADEGRSVTVESLRIEIEGQPPARRLRAVAGGHHAEPERGVYWEQ